MKPLLLVLALVTPALALTFEQAVRHCVLEVHRRNPYSMFDAYVSDENEVRSIGTPFDRFAFNKCMHEAGHDLGPTVLE